MNTTTLQATVPEQLLRQAMGLVSQGWSSSLDALVVDALRRYLESHEPRLTETFLRDDLRWGLDGEK